ncbi:MAG TPA: UbiA family prenyltransferase [Phycisphaerae bacterium]
MSRLRAWLQLMRIGNVFTAIADVLAGGLFVGAVPNDLRRLWVAAGASALLYTAGMILNDVFDIRKDRSERPTRPLPSGAVPLRSAAIVGAAMLLAGWAILATLQLSTALAGTALALAIVAYDGAVKNTPAAPAMMGLCRALNLALGMLIVGTPWRWPQYTAVSLMWLYIASVTLFARREAGVSTLVRLAVGSAGVGAAIVGVALIALLHPARATAPWLVWLACAGLLLLLAIPAGRALRSRAPQNVQTAVISFIFGLVLFDALLVLIARGPALALATAALIVPTIVIGRWIRPT